MPSTLPVAGRSKKDESFKNLSGSQAASNTPKTATGSRSGIKLALDLPTTTRSQVSNAPSDRKGRVMTLDGKLLGSTNRKEVNSLLEDVIQNNKYLNHKLTTNTHTFKDVLIYCQKTIENQDGQIERLDEAVERLNDQYEDKLRNERRCFQNELNESKIIIDRLNTENLLMRTQLINLEQLELELKEAKQSVEKIQQELDDKSKLLGEREFQRRELIIVTTERVRRELEGEFAKEIEKVKKEFQIQHRAVLEANQHVIRKTKLELKAIKDEKAHNQSEVRRLLEELESRKLDYVAIEKEKTTLDKMVKNINSQADQKVYELRQHVEEVELKMRQGNQEHNKEVARLTTELEGLNERFEAKEKQLRTCQSNLRSQTVCSY